MDYLSLGYFVLVGGVFIAYYILPLKIRWTSLLIGSIFFYFLAYKKGWWIILSTAVFSYVASLFIEKAATNRMLQRLLFAATIVIVSAPWFQTKTIRPLLEALKISRSINWVVPMGISFYTLQIIAYLADVLKGKTSAEKNPFKYLLYVIYFPQILQGPIPRYERMAGQLYDGHRFDEEKFLKGIIYIGWGFFLKLMIADKAAIIVDPIFNNYRAYKGLYVFVGGILYSIQLYADFLACTSISRGVSSLFGIALDDNFKQPYFAVSIQDFWRRWHISLSSWLRDYIYIPLGGSRKGKLHKYINLAVTFLVSGIWHGAGLNFIVWGLMHAFLQISGEVLRPLRSALYARIDFKAKDTVFKYLSMLWTFGCVTVAWVVFRADDLLTALRMLKSVLFTVNPWILTDNSLLNMGLSWKGWAVLILSIMLLWHVSKMKESGADPAKAIMDLPLILRWIVFLSMFFAIMTFGTYGTGFDAKTFIYGGF